MQTMRFSYQGRGTYHCVHHEGDQSGEYVRAEVAQRLLAACKRSRDVMATDAENDLEEWEETLADLESAIAFADPVPEDTNPNP